MDHARLWVAGAGLMLVGRAVSFVSWCALTRTHPLEADTPKVDRNRPRGRSCMAIWTSQLPHILRNHPGQHPEGGIHAAREAPDNRYAHTHTQCRSPCDTHKTGHHSLPLLAAPLGEPASRFHHPRKGQDRNCKLPACIGGRAARRCAVAHRAARAQPAGSLQLVKGVSSSGTNL